MHSEHNEERDGCGLTLIGHVLWLIFTLVGWWLLKTSGGTWWYPVIFGLVTYWFFILGRGFESVKWHDYLNDTDNKES